MAAASRFIAPACAAALAGCAGAGAPLQQLASLPALGVPNEARQAEASPTEVYRRIASGAVACWFAPGGALAGTHMFHADADPPTKGGAAEIYVHERDREGPKPWGLKVFRISLAAAGDNTAIEVRNLKLPEPLAVQMRADAVQWAVGGQSCKAGEGGTGFNPPEASPPQAVAKPGPKAKVKLRPKAG